MTPLTSGQLTKYDTADQWASKFDMRWLLLKGISIKNNTYSRQIVLLYTISFTFIQKISKKALTRVSGANIKI
jgi:hypothetical protein